MGNYNLDDVLMEARALETNICCICGQESCIGHTMQYVDVQPIERTDPGGVKVFTLPPEVPSGFAINLKLGDEAIRIEVPENGIKIVESKELKAEDFPPGNPNVF